MTTTDATATDAELFTPPPHPHHPPVLIGVEIATVDQYGDPGFVCYRGDFHTASAAAGFAITQAHNVITARELGRVAVTLTDHTRTHPGSEYDDTVTVIGSTGEIACALAADPAYSTGVRRVELPAAADVLDIIAATFDDLGAIDADADHRHSVDNDDDDDEWFVHVHTVRPGPVPNSTTMFGPLVRSRAESAAGLLAHRIGGDLTTHLDRGVIALRHPATVSEEDEQAVQRYERITAAAATLATVPTGSDEHRLLVAEISDLRGAAHHPGGHR
ncbi:hypothetical protein [Rhodococcoides yunnanense]|uniref:hypothetical protein n=1 Tax=Rhodococcoides yunnanense TaxID=278209 RepID=UPI0022B1D774|nr:hypothetical protein [Rhodococcus yunnanensis]MCZ4277425.1 hypothetical protein [Rhodococcus yunnanensis]